MSWRTAATVLVVVAVAIMVWMTLGDPLVQIANSFQGLETSGQFNTDSKIDAMVRGWFNMFLILIFGVMAWGVWRVVRKELTRGGL